LVYDTVGLFVLHPEVAADMSLWYDDTPSTSWRGFITKETTVRIFGIVKVSEEIDQEILCR
jgi:hypothetical protein